MEAKLLSTDRPIAIYYSFQSDVESIAPSGTNAMAVTFKAGKDWKAIHTTIGTIDLQENTEQSAAGTIFNNNLTAQCPGHDEGTPGDVAAISGRKALIRIDYKSGKKKLIGNLNAAPRLFLKVTSNTTTSRKLESAWKSAQANCWLA